MMVEIKAQRAFWWLIPGLQECFFPPQLSHPLPSIYVDAQQHRLISHPLSSFVIAFIPPSLFYPQPPVFFPAPIACFTISTPRVCLPQIYAFKGHKWLSTCFSWRPLLMHTNRSGARWPVSGQGGWHKGYSITPNQQTTLPEREDKQIRLLGIETL